MKELTIYFDLDGTLINPREIMNGIREKLAEEGVSPEIFDQVLTEYTNSLPSRTQFEPTELIRSLYQTLKAQGIRLDRIELTQKFYEPAIYQHAVYPDTKPVLNLLQAQYPMKLWSQGKSMWQRDKLDLSGLGSYFPHKNRIITPRKLATVILKSLDTPGIIVDDKPDVIFYLMSKIPGIIPIWINRFGSQQTSILSVSNLEELPEKIAHINTAVLTKAERNA